MSGSFTSGRFRFEVEYSDWEINKARGFSARLDHDFGVRLTRTGKVPDLGGAPIASWLLARLAHLTDDVLGLDDVEDNDGGGYMIEFVVYRTYVEPVIKKGTFVHPYLFDVAKLGLHIEPDKPIAAFQFQADMEGASVLGDADPDYPAEEILEALAAALLEAPNDLLGRELVVRDPEWKLDPEMYVPRPTKGSKNWYGWDGYQFLGAANIREAD